MKALKSTGTITRPDVPRWQSRTYPYYFYRLWLVPCYWYGRLLPILTSLGGHPNLNARLYGNDPGTSSIQAYRSIILWLLQYWFFLTTPTASPTLMTLFNCWTHQYCIPFHSIHNGETSYEKNGNKVLFKVQTRAEQVFTGTPQWVKGGEHSTGFLDNLSNTHTDGFKTLSQTIQGFFELVQSFLRLH